VTTTQHSQHHRSPLLFSAADSESGALAVLLLKTKGNASIINFHYFPLSTNHQQLLTF
jgi:hypothetical protein